MAETPHRMCWMLALTVATVAISGLQSTAAQVVGNNVNLVFDDRNAPEQFKQIDASVDTDVHELMLLSVDGESVYNTFLANGATKSMEPGRRVLRRRRRRNTEISGLDNDQYETTSSEPITTPGADEPEMSSTESSSTTEREYTTDDSSSIPTTSEESIPVAPTLRPPLTIQVDITSPTDSPQSVESENGKSIELKCNGYLMEYGHKIRPIPINWHRRDGQLPDDRSYQDHRSGSLLLEKVQPDDSAIYVCQAVSGGETVEKEVTVTVFSNSPPRITLVPAVVRARVGEQVDIQCTSTGNTPIHYQWQRIDNELSIDAHVNETLLRFAAIRRSDEGAYRCRVENQFGDDTRMLRIYVSGSNEIEDAPTPPPPPTIKVDTTSPTLQIVEIGTTVELKCDGYFSAYFYGFPIPINWHRRDGQLPDNRSHQDHQRGSLLLENVQPDDSAIYVCQAVSGGETVEKELTVTVVSPSDKDKGCSEQVSSDELKCPKPIRNNTTRQEDEWDETASSLAEHLRIAVAKFPTLADEFRRQLLRMQIHAQIRRTEMRQNKLNAY